MVTQCLRKWKGCVRGKRVLAFQFGLPILCAVIVLTLCYHLENGNIRSFRAFSHLFFVYFDSLVFCTLYSTQPPPLDLTIPSYLSSDLAVGGANALLQLDTKALFSGNALLSPVTPRNGSLGGVLDWLLSPSTCAYALPVTHCLLCPHSVLYLLLFPLHQIHLPLTPHSTPHL